MDPRIEEILQITKDTNRMVHKMRRAQLWGRFYQIAWWVAILAISGAAYYYYAQPYLDSITQLYAQMQQGGQQAQNFGSQLSSFFGSWVPHAATTTTPQ